MKRSHVLIGLGLVATIALISTAIAGPGGGTTASASVSKQLKKLKRTVAGQQQQISRLQQQLDQLARQPGPQGPQGPAGTAPACQGNGSGDVMVAAGAVCIDRYEASVWSSPTGGTQLTTEAQIDAACPDNGQNCPGIFARSVPGVEPARRITYFQAQQALANVGKRLPTNAEWQQAVAGTPDPGTDNGTTDCNVDSTISVSNTGSRSACVSRFGAFDMVGNLWEWVGDWDEVAGGCASWPAGFGSDFTCLGMADTDVSTRFPAALIRGGFFTDGSGAGPFAVFGGNRPSDSGNSGIGFRGAR
jgi:formylglycine-generating enzyme required for sulfatase activity